MIRHTLRSALLFGAGLLLAGADAQPAPAQSTAPQSTAPQSTAPQSTAPQSTAPQSTAPQSTTPQSGAPQSAAATPPAAASDDVVAKRGNLQLTVGDARVALDHSDPTARAQVLGNPAALAEFVRDRLLRQVLLNEAHEAKWDQSPDVIARVSDLRDTVVAQTWLGSRVQPDPNYPSAAEIGAAYDANRSRFVMPKQYHLQQIAILVPPGASKDVDADARKKIGELRLQALKPKADFSELAKKASQDKTSADHGGDLDWVREDQIVPGIRDAVRGMAVNAISDPIRSTEAWHLIKVVGTRPPSYLPLEQVRDVLVNALRQTRTQQMMKAYVDDLLRKEPVQVNEVGLAARLAGPK